MNNLNIRVPYGKSVHGKEEIKAVLNVLKRSRAKSRFVTNSFLS